MIKKIFIIILTIILSGCGYQVTKMTNYEGLKLSNIDINGEKRINFHLKNNIFSLVPSEKDGLVSLEITTEKNRSFKEKNIKNEITKYKLKVIAKVVVVTNNINRSKPIAFSKSGDYNVSAQRSQTLNNEKQLVKRLSEDIAVEIVEMLSNY
tara:strand:+ start:254 stop:709 length:456 start_codon:yes stop_codon:yes gene_type:complete